MNNEELSEKIDTLSEYDKEQFMEKMNQTVKKNLTLFNSTPDQVITDEALEEHQEILKEVEEKWVNDLHEFIKYS